MANILESPTNIEDEAFEEEINVEREDFELVVPENYDDLLGLPQINGVTLTGNKTSSDLGIITQEQVDNAIQTESQARSSADTELNNKINAESTTRGEADTALGTRIDNEALARQNADNGLQSQIDAITSKSDVVDVVANYAALQAYDTSTLGNNDVVKVLDDETHEDALTYYRWSTMTQTWTYIGQEAPYYSKGQMDVKLAEKQDKLTAGANIQIQNGTISATDTTYTAGNGLNLNGTEFSADTTVLATKEDLEGYYTKPETDNLLAPKLETEVVAELPATGEEGKLYLTPKAHTTQTATGNPITATVAEEAGKIESFQLDGDTYQQSYEGKNLIDIPDIDGTSSSGVVRDISDNVIDLSGTVTADWGFNIASGSLAASFARPLPAGTYTVSLNKTVSIPIKVTFNNANSQTLKTATIDAGNLSATVEITDTATKSTVWSNAARNTQVSVSGLQIMVESGISATTFEPYVGGVPSPNPDYPQAIQTVTGEQMVTIASINLFDGIFELGNISTTTGTDINADTMIRSKNYAVIEGGEKYTISVVDGGNVALRFYQSDGTFVGTGTTGSSPNTFTAPANAGRVRFIITSNTNLSTKAQCEKGSSATDWTPYYEPSNYPLDLGSIELCKLGTYQDYIWKDGDDWKVHKATNKITVDGSENWQFPDSGANHTFFQFSRYYFGIKYGENADFYASNTEVGFAKADKFEQVIASSANMRTEQGIGFTTEGKGWFRISVANTIATTIEAFKTWLSNHPTTTYYALATATDITITDQTLIAQLEAIRTASLETGANTITNSATGSNLAGDMEVGYYGFNPRNRYDKWLWLDINNEYEQIGS